MSENLETEWFWVLLIVDSDWCCLLGKQDRRRLVEKGHELHNPSVCEVGGNQARMFSLIELVGSGVSTKYMSVLGVFPERHKNDWKVLEESKFRISHLCKQGLTSHPSRRELRLHAPAFLPA